jgi:hypothetical protein
MTRSFLERADEYENGGEYAVHPILMRAPIRPSRSKEEKRAAVIFAVGIILVVAVMIVAVLKASNDPCMLEGSADLCITH